MDAVGNGMVRWDVGLAVMLVGWRKSVARRGGARLGRREILSYIGEFGDSFIVTGEEGDSGLPLPARNGAPASACAAGLMTAAVTRTAPSSAEGSAGRQKTNKSIFLTKKAEESQKEAEDYSVTIVHRTYLVPVLCTYKFSFKGLVPASLTLYWNEAERAIIPAS